MTKVLRITHQTYVRATHGDKILFRIPKKTKTVTLSDKAVQYLANVMYGLEVPDDKNDGETRPATISEAVNESLESLFDFETTTDDQLVNWLEENYQLYSKRKAEKDAFIERQLNLINELNSKQ